MSQQGALLVEAVRGKKGCLIDQSQSRIKTRRGW